MGCLKLTYYPESSPLKVVKDFSFSTEKSDAGAYRYGFNGKENDPEDGWQDYGMRMYNPRLGRFFSVDPITHKYPMLTPYQFASNCPIRYVDIDGLEAGDSPQQTNWTFGYFIGIPIANFRYILANVEKRGGVTFQPQNSNFINGFGGVSLTGVVEHQDGLGNFKIKNMTATGQISLNVTNDPSPFVNNGAFNINGIAKYKSGSISANLSAEGQNKVAFINYPFAAFYNNEQSIITNTAKSEDDQTTDSAIPKVQTENQTANSSNFSYSKHKTGATLFGSNNKTPVVRKSLYKTASRLYKL